MNKEKIAKLEKELKAVFENSLKTCSIVNNWDVQSVKACDFVLTEGNEKPSGTYQEFIFSVVARPRLKDNQSVRDLDPIVSTRNLDKIIQSYFWEQKLDITVEREIYLGTLIVIPVVVLI